MRVEGTRAVALVSATCEALTAPRPRSQECLHVVSTPTQTIFRVPVEVTGLACSRVYESSQPHSRLNKQFERQAVFTGHKAGIVSLAVSGTLRRTKRNTQPFRLFALLRWFGLLRPIPGDYIVSGGGDGAVLLFDRRTAKVRDLGGFYVAAGLPFALPATRLSTTRALR